MHNNQKDINQKYEKQQNGLKNLYFLSDSFKVYDCVHTQEVETKL